MTSLAGIFGVWTREAILFLFKSSEKDCAAGFEEAWSLCFFLDEGEGDKEGDLKDEGEGDEEGNLYFLPCCTLPFTT